jgi:hypothetical protein
MEFKVGRFTARCTACDGTVFDEQRPESGPLHSRFRCSGCGAETTYADLIEQIGARSRRAKAPAAAASAVSAMATAADVFAATIPGLIAQRRVPKPIA